MMFIDPGHWRHLLCVLLALCAAGSAAMPNLIIGPGGIGRSPGHLGEIDPGCWDSSSLAVIQTRRLRVADSVTALWDFMTFLRASQQQRHNDLFLDLAQHFWAMYVDCVLSRAHGLGKRYTTLSEFRITEFSPNYARNYA